MIAAISAAAGLLFGGIRRGHASVKNASSDSPASINFSMMTVMIVPDEKTSSTTRTLAYAPSCPWMLPKALMLARNSGRSGRW